MDKRQDENSYKVMQKEQNLLIARQKANNSSKVLKKITIDKLSGSPQGTI